MSAHDVKLFGDQIAASRLETRFASFKASSLLRLVIEDLYPGRVALVSSFGADAAALLHMVSRVDAKTPVIFVDTGQHFPGDARLSRRAVETLGLEERDRRRAAARRRLTRRTRRSSCSRAIRTAAARSARFVRSPMRWRAMTRGSPGGRVSRAPTRATLPLFEAEGERVKVNPLVGWSATDVLELHQGSRPAAPPAGREGFPVDRLPALHEPGAGPARTSAPAGGAGAARPNAAFMSGRSTPGPTSDAAVAPRGLRRGRLDVCGGRRACS